MAVLAPFRDDDDDEVKEKPEIIRRYQNRNLKDLEFPDFETVDVDASRSAAPGTETAVRARHASIESVAGAASGADTSTQLPYFAKKSRYHTGTVLEESVLDIGHERIKQSAFMKSLDQRFVTELFKVDDCIRSVVYLPGQEISREGEKADSLVVIAKGEAQVIVNNVPQQRLVEGDHFGCRNFVGASADRAATVVALTFCDVRLMYKDAFFRTLEKCPTSKHDLQQMLYVWREHSHRHGLRATQILSERFGEWLDPPENFGIPCPPKRLGGTGRGGVPLYAAGGDSGAGFFSSEASSSLRKIGSTPARAAQAILTAR